MDEFYPLLFEPVLKHYVWGGRNLERLYGRQIPPRRVAESWEIAAHSAGTTPVRNGPYSGLTLEQLQELLGVELVGRHGAWSLERGKFPLLIKLLDAQKKLSVQVHPDDAYALAHEENELGKSEMWVVLDAKPDAAVILGVKDGTTPEEFRSAIHQGRLQDFLHRLPVKAGDFVCVPSGSLHAILGGLVLAEIQQNSNATYRVYDWGRNAADRQLHVDQALDVIDFTQVEPTLPSASLLYEKEGVHCELLCRNQYFTVERLKLSEGAIYRGECGGGSLEIWGVIAGQAVVTGDRGFVPQDLRTIAFALLPASLGHFLITAKTESVLLRTYLA